LSSGGSPKRKDDVIVTKLRRDHWKVGAQILACVHDLIRFEGPYVFVSSCIYDELLSDSSNLLKTVARGHGSSAVKAFVRYMFAFMFVIVMPFLSPLVVAQFMVKFTWGYTKDGEIFELHNFVINATRLAKLLAANNTVTVLQDAVEQDADAVAYLKNQKFQNHMCNPDVQFYTGLGTVGLLIFYMGVIQLSKHSKFLKQNFIMPILHFLWISPDYPKLQYTSGVINLLGVHLKLFELVPAAWLSTVSSFLIVLPLSALVQEGDLMILKTVMPSALFAAFAFGKIYMQLANASFFAWLSTEKDYALVHRQFNLNPIFTALMGAGPMFTVTVDEIEYMANNELMHTALLKCARVSEEQQDSVRAQADGRADAWHAMQSTITKYARNYWMLRYIFVKDISADAAGTFFTIDVATGEELKEG